MSMLRRELVFMILQFFEKEGFQQTIHKLEKESGEYFNMKYFEDCVKDGEWDEVENYLSAFTRHEDNAYSRKTFFEIRKQKYLEALDSHDYTKAQQILVKDLKVFSTFNEETFEQLTQLLSLDNFREKEQLSTYGDTSSSRANLVSHVKRLIEENPRFRDKLQLPNLEDSRLKTLLNQSLNWQHKLCKYPQPLPNIKTLLVDHICERPPDINERKVLELMEAQEKLREIASHILMHESSAVRPETPEFTATEGEASSQDEDEDEGIMDIDPFEDDDSEDSQTKTL